MKDCPVCNGTGTDVKIDMGPKFPQFSNAGRMCNTCRGTGKISNKKFASQLREQSKGE
jgi:DnaJ-class molecular chaperone